MRKTLNFTFDLEFIQLAEVCNFDVNAYKKERIFLNISAEFSKGSVPKLRLNYTFSCVNETSYRLKAQKITQTKSNRKQIET